MKYRLVRYTIRFVIPSYTDIPSKYIVCLHKIFKTPSRHVFKTSSRHVFKTSSRHVFKTSSRYVFRTFSRRLQDVFCVTFFCLPRSLQDVFARRLCKMSSRRLGRRKIVMLKTCWRRLQDMSWRGLQDVFKTNKCLLGSNRLQMFCQTSVLKNLAKFSGVFLWILWNF